MQTRHFPRIGFFLLLWLHVNCQDLWAGPRENVAEPTETFPMQEARKSAFAGTGRIIAEIQKVDLVNTQGVPYWRWRVFEFEIEETWKGTDSGVVTFAWSETGRLPEELLRELFPIDERVAIFLLDSRASSRPNEPEPPSAFRLSGSLGPVRTQCKRDANRPACSGDDIKCRLSCELACVLETESDWARLKDAVRNIGIFGCDTASIRNHLLRFSQAEDLEMVILALAARIRYREVSALHELAVVLTSRHLVPASLQRTLVSAFYTTAFDCAEAADECAKLVLCVPMDISLRRQVAVTLAQRISSEHCVPYLTKLLDDPDREVRCIAALGLYEWEKKDKKYAISSPEYTPHVSDTADQDACVALWKKWWEEYGKRKYRHVLEEMAGEAAVKPANAEK